MTGCLLSEHCGRAEAVLFNRNQTGKTRLRDGGYCLPEPILWFEKSHYDTI